MRRDWLKVLTTIVCLALFVVFAVGSFDGAKDKQEVGVEEIAPEEEAGYEEAEEVTDYVSNEPAEAESVTDAIKITGNALYAAYAADAVVADEKYYGKYLEVDGTVQGLSRDMFGTVILELTAGSGDGKIQCYIAPKFVPQAKQLKSGQSVRVRGKCDGFANSTYVMLKGSIIL